MQITDYERVWIEGLNRGDASVADEVFASECVIHINGPFGAVPATGRRVRIDGLILDRVAGGKVVERWEQWDQASMMQQLGLA